MTIRDEGEGQGQVQGQVQVEGQVQGQGEGEEGEDVDNAANVESPVSSFRLSVSIPFKMKRGFLDFHSEEDVLLPHGGTINVVRFASDVYKKQVD